MFKRDRFTLYVSLPWSERDISQSIYLHQSRLCLPNVVYPQERPPLGTMVRLILTYRSHGKDCEGTRQATEDAEDLSGYPNPPNLTASDSHLIIFPSLHAPVCLHCQPLMTTFRLEPQCDISSPCMALVHRPSSATL